MDKSLYLYCAAPGSRDEPMEIKGIDGGEVFTVAAGGICAVVQGCEGAFSSEDTKLASEWILAHQAVVDLAWERYETVVPFSFDTIVVAKDGLTTARESLLEWLEKEGPSLKSKLERFRGKAEYGVQISWDPNVIGPRIFKNDSEIRKLEQEIQSKPAGTAYLLKQKLGSLLRIRLETAADVYFKEFYQKIRDGVEAVQVEKVKKEEPPKQMLANLSCLAPKGEVSELGAALEKIGKIDGFFVRFTGPWPPYSFVNS